MSNRIRDQIDADAEGVEAAAADVAALELSVTSRLATGWFAAIEASLLVDLSAEDIRTQERSLRLTQRRFESGLTGSSDVRLARSAIASSQALEQSRLQLRDSTLRAVQVLAREYPDANIALPDDLPPLPPLTGIGTPAEMLARRPDVIAVENREAALRISRDEAVMAEERLELRYTEGLVSILQLLDAQTRRLNAEGQLITARAERLANRVRLHVALGGSGYTAPDGLQDVPPVEFLGIDLP